MTATALQELARSLHNCERCKLAKLGRTQVVFGVGNPHASIMFVGEAPGFNEDQKGEPFVGAAGKLLNDLLASAGLSREQIYIANVIKCRPPNNRDPEPDEVETCKPFLMQQIQMIRPKLVCTLGNWATQTLLERKVGITKVKAQAFYMKDFVIFPLLHPAAALHQGNLLDTLKEDFKKLKQSSDSTNGSVRLISIHCFSTSSTPELFCECRPECKITFLLPMMKR
jgi:uracil-DNA glycosylase